MVEEHESLENKFWMTSVQQNSGLFQACRPEATTQGAWCGSFLIPPPFCHTLCPTYPEVISSNPETPAKKIIIIKIITRKFEWLWFLQIFLSSRYFSWKFSIWKVNKGAEEKEKRLDGKEDGERWSLLIFLCKDFFLAATSGGRRKDHPSCFKIPSIQPRTSFPKT